MEFKEGDFVKLDYDLYANGSLVQTTDAKKATELKTEQKNVKPFEMILGKGFLLKALDEDILKNNKSNTLELTAEKAYGKRQKELIKTFPKSVFDEQKLRAVPGMVYDFNGMYGTVKSVVGGRVMVDFNNPLSGKDIKVEYKVLEKIENITEKVRLVFERVLRIPSTMFKAEKKDKELILKIPQQLVVMKEQLEKSLEEMIPEIKDYSIKIENFKKE